MSSGVSDLLCSREFDPHVTLRALRGWAPVHPAVLPSSLPVWVVTDDEHARMALADPRLGSSSARLNEIMRGKLRAADADARPSLLWHHKLLVPDPPDHTRLRTLLAGAVTAARVERLRPHIEQITADLFEEIPTATEVDLVGRVACPLPIMVICELLGVPPADHALMRAWAQALMGRTPARPAAEQMSAYLAELIETKRRTPGEDLLSALTRAAGDGNRPTEAELLATCALLVAASHETTVSLISASADWLLRDHATRRRLVEDLRLIPQAVDELLRLTSPVATAAARYTIHPLRIGDVTVPAGEIVLIHLAAANRDPVRHHRPDDLDLDRAGRGHPAVGHGIHIHYCLGAPLARLQGEIALRQLLQRFPRYRRSVPADQFEPHRFHTVTGWRPLPVVLVPAWTL